MDEAKMEAAIHPSSDPPLLTSPDDGQTNGPEKNTAAATDHAKGALSKSARRREKRKKKKQVKDERDKGHDEAAAENETRAQEAEAAEDERTAQEAETAAEDDRRTREAEAVEYERRTQEAESGRAMAIRELGGAARAIEGLSRSVETAQAEEARAREEAELAVLRLRETEKGAGQSAELDDVRRRHAATLEDLRSARAELESLRSERAAAAAEVDAVVARAREVAASSREAGAAVEELAALKGEVEASRAAHEAAEEMRMKMTWALKEEKARWLAELEGREDEVRKLEDDVAEARDIESKVAAASEQLASLKAELFTRAVEGTMGDEEEDGKPTLISPVALEKTRRELEEVKASVEKAKDEAKILRVAAASLRADLDREKAELAALRDLALSSASVPALEEELSRVTSELAAAEARAKQSGGPESTTTTPEQLSEARQEMERAKESARTAREDVAKARDVARLAKAAVDAMELRLEAVMREILAADASAETAAASADALLQSQAGAVEGGVTLTVEEYGRLSSRAREAEELAGKRVTEAVRLVEEATDAEARSLDGLARLATEADRRKRVLQAATAQAEDAELGKLSAEMELRKWRADHQHQRQLSGASSSAPRGLAEISMFVDDSSAGGDKNPHVLSPRARYVRRTDAAVGREEEDGKARKAFFFPRMVMFLARKKAHTHNLNNK